MDWAFDAIRRKTTEGNYEAVNYHRFADDIVITVSGHHTKRGWAERALQRLHEQLAPLGVELNKEKTKVVDTLKGEAFGFLGFDLRRTRKRKGNGHYIQMTPKKKARKAIKAKVRDIIQHSGATPIRVCLVNSKHVKHVPGRKTDVQDCQWLQYLHSVGLLWASFRPDDEICALRSLSRHRASLVESAAMHVQHMHKALTQMNLQIHHVLSDITGLSGMAMRSELYRIFGADLTAIPGISALTAHTPLAEIGPDLEHFRNTCRLFYSISRRLFFDGKAT